MSVQFSDVVDNALQIIVSGIVAVVVKRLGEAIQPHLKKWWNQFMKWLRAEDDDESDLQ